MLELVKLVGWNESLLSEKHSNSDLSFSRVERNEMGHRCCTKQKVKRGLWSPEEDEKLITHITTYGHGSWSSVPKLAGLQRCGKSCRLRWINYLRPDLKKGSFTQEEEQIIIDVHRILGNRWAQIAKHLPGRTDNEVKNFWNSCIKKKLISQGLDPQTHNLISSSQNQKSSVSNNKISNTTSFVVSHETVQKQPIISAFSMKSTNNICSDEDHNLLNPPLLTTPPYNNAQTTPNISSLSSSSVNILHLSKSCLLDDQFGIWDSSFPPFEAPKTVSEREHRKSLQGQHYNNIQQQQLLENHQKIWEMQNDINSFENDDCFDNGFVTESAAHMYEALMSQDFSPAQYDLAWNY